jgi:signal transduction histidine kinase
VHPLCIIAFDFPHQPMMYISLLIGVMFAVLAILDDRGNHSISNWAVRVFRRVITHVFPCMATLMLTCGSMLYARQVGWIEPVKTEETSAVMDSAEESSSDEDAEEEDPFMEEEDDMEEEEEEEEEEDPPARAYT